MQEKKKQEGKEALRMLKELKTVMGVRAQQREERERKALLRMQGEEEEEEETVNKGIAEDNQEMGNQQADVPTADNSAQTLGAANVSYRW